MIDNIFFNLRNVLSRNCLFNFIIGERGVGKTFSSKEFVLNRFLKHGEQFIYLRRYATEVEQSMGTKSNPKFWEQIKEFHTDHEFSNSKDKIYVDGKLAGYSFALSKGITLKGTSFNKVTTIIFDEFLIDSGCYHYLQNDVRSFLDFYETVARLRNNVRVLFLGNAIASYSNPYFAYFDLSLPYGKDIKVFNDEILVNYIKNEPYREKKKESRFGKIIKGTAYEKYAIDNQFINDTRSFVEKKTATSRFFCMITYNDHKFGIWKDWSTSLMYVSFDVDQHTIINFAFKNSDHDEHTRLLSRSNVFVKAIIEYYRAGLLRYESQKIKGLFQECILSYITR